MSSEMTFQGRVQPWMLACFGEAIADDREERNHRFLEEALELVQACGATASEAHQLVDYVYGRPTGEKHQEVGGVMVTLAALCLAHRFDMHKAGETELARVWTKIDQIRAKQAAKPKHSPLPEAAPHRLRCGDHVHHRPSDEKWVVAFADYDTGEMAPAGWPDSRARIVDCQLVRAATDEKHQQAVDEWLRPESGHDSRRHAIRRLYGTPLAASLASADPPPVAWRARSPEGRWHLSSVPFSPDEAREHGWEVQPLYTALSGPDVRDGAMWNPTHRHYKGGLYRELHRGTNEADTRPIVVYQGEDGASGPGRPTTST